MDRDIQELTIILRKAESEAILASELVDVNTEAIHDEDDDQLLNLMFTAKDAIFGLEVTRDSEELAEKDLRRMLIPIFYEHSTERLEVLKLSNKAETTP